MKKLLLVATVLLSLLLTACHGARDTTSFQIPEEFDTTRQYEITFWAKNDTNKTQVEIYQHAIDEFQKIYPNITVNLRLYTDYSRIYNDVITNIATGTTPNVCITYPDHIATYLTGDNVVVPLDSLMDDSNYGLGGKMVAFASPSRSEVVSEYLEECQVNGYYYALPFMRSTEVCYVNKTFVEALGYELPEVLTWDFIWEVSDAAMEKDENGLYKVNGQNVLIPFIYKSTDNMMIQMTEQLESGYSTDEGEIRLFNDTTKDILYEIAKHTANGAFSTFKISSYPANFLNAGQCIFAIDSTAGSTWMGSDAPLVDISEDKLVEFETEVMIIPQYNTDDPQMISQGPSVCVFNKSDSQEVLASWLFAQYLLTNDVQIAYSETEGYSPVTTLARQSEEYQDYLSREGEDNEMYYEVKLQATKLLLENTSNTFVTPVYNGSASLRDAAGQLIENTVKSVRRKENIDDSYMEKLFSDVQSLYRLDQIGGSQGGDNGKKSLGPLPTESIILIVTLIVIWLFLGAFALSGWMKQLQKRRN